MKHKLYFAPRSFPYGKNEVPFLYTEFQKLAKVFDITIVAAAFRADEENYVNEFEPFRSIKTINIDYQNIGKFKRFELIFACMRNPIFRREIYKIIKMRDNVAMRLYQAILLFSYALKFADELEKRKVITDQQAVFYTYWYDVQTMGIILLKKKYPNLKIVSRIHGFDLYNEQRPGNYQPFRDWMDKNVEQLFFISATGKEYYLKNIIQSSDQPDKYLIRYIGTNCRGIYSPDNITDIFSIVTCSSLIPLKRVNLIIDALSSIPKNYRIKWRHYGDGICGEELKKSAMEKLSNCENISYEFVGNVDNYIILNAYEEYPVDCFINVSSTEGLPISAQEALGYGIPLILSDVGGNRELVNENGIMLSANPSPDEIQKALLRLIDVSHDEKSRMHQKSMKLWCEKYDASVNADKFVQDIIMLYR